MPAKPTTPKRKPAAKQQASGGRRPSPCSPSFLSDDECKEILVSACTVRPHTEEELTALIRWAELARMDNMLVDMVIKGKIRVEWTPDGEPQFNSVNVRPLAPADNQTPDANDTP